MSDERHRMAFPVVALPGEGNFPAPSADDKDAAQVLHVAATRTTQRLVIGGNEELFSLPPSALSAH